jgi:hypothetical protein
MGEGVWAEGLEGMEEKAGAGVVEPGRMSVGDAGRREWG